MAQHARPSVYKAAAQKSMAEIVGRCLACVPDMIGNAMPPTYGTGPGKVRRVNHTLLERLANANP